jgi:ATP-binding cassette subfamily F protein 3
MQQRCAFLEEEIPRIEAAMVLSERELGNFVSMEDTARQTLLLDGLRREHAALTAEWEQLAAELEEQAAV